MTKQIQRMLQLVKTFQYLLHAIGFLDAYFLTQPALPP